MANTRLAPTAIPQEVLLFGPQQYVRTTGSQDVYNATIAVPKWLVAPFRLHIQNGAATTTDDRVSSGTIVINSTTVITSPSDLNKNVATLDRTITLNASNTMTVTLASDPASYLTLSIYGTTADLTAPQLTFAQPGPGSTINTTTPHLVFRYGDLLGTGEPAASGADPKSLKVVIDDVNRSKLFTRRSDEATADIPASSALTEGPHSYKASIADYAGNTTEITGTFRVDTRVPQIAIVQPAAASYLSTKTPAIALTYADETALDLNTLRVTFNGVDRTAQFVKTATDATASWATATPLTEGPIQIVAHIADLGGNEATASLSFNVDVTPPSLAIVAPPAGARFGSRDVAVTLSFNDLQAIAASTASATIDGTAVTLTIGSDKATALLTNLAEGSHTLAARVADRAQNVTTATASFIVDTTVPDIRVVEPPAGANVRTNTPTISITWADQDGVDRSTFKATINGTDRTLLFMQPSASAPPATLTGFALPEGVNTVAAEIRDLTANLGKTVSNFFVDTVAPTGTIDAPADRVKSNSPDVVIHYSDGGSGIDPTSVRVFVDGANQSALITAAADEATGTLALTPPLVDGAHEIRVIFADVAGNSTTLTKQFVVDTKNPALTIVTPKNDSFLNTTTPALRISYADPQGTGVNVASIKLYLHRGTDADTDVTSYVTIGAAEAIGSIPDTSKLADGTYHLRAVVSDLAGNGSTAEAAFEVDTVAPTYQVESPAPNDSIATARPAFSIRYNDELSGVDTTRAIVKIDNVDRTSLFTFDASAATATLPAGETLAQGAHTIQVTLFDRAGNQAAAATQTFTVDTIAPVAVIESPLNGSYIGLAPYTFAVTYADANGSGIDTATVRITIDGADRTSEFAVGAARATASLATVLVDGSHTIAVTAMDWAGNAATATSMFTVDSVAPKLQITSPTSSVWLQGPTIPVSGTVADSSPVSVEVNGTLVATTSGAFATVVPSSDGLLTIHAVARDAAGNSSTAEVKVNVDTVAPVITVTAPAGGFVTKDATARIVGTITDASELTVTLNGQPLPLTSNAFSVDVNLAAEGTNDFTIVATDAAKNSSTRKVSIVRDTIAPQVTIASPIASSVLGTVPVVVRGTFVDATAVTITVDGVAATVTADAFEASIPGLSEGPHTFNVVARDAAGNSTPATRTVTIDLVAPVVVIATPASGSLTKEATTTITGTATDVSLVSVKSAGITATLTEGTTTDEKTFTIVGVPLLDGDNTLHVVAADALSRTTDQTLLVTRDSIAPTVTLDAPDVITKSRGAAVSATVTDNLSVKSVVFTLDTTPIASLTAPPFQANVAVPTSKLPGYILTLAVVATDKAGNVTTISKPIKVIAEGAVIGRVLADNSGLPVPGARVRVVGTNSVATTDDHGRYALPAKDMSIVLVTDVTDAAHPVMPVERTAAVQSSVGTVPVDVRLTQLAPATFIGSGGGAIGTGSVTVNVPANAVSTTTGMHVTPLSPQGLPNLLPLGWTPVAAFDVRVDGSLAAPLPFDATINALPAIQVHVIEYKASLHAWVMLQANVTPSGGALHVSLPEPATYAVVAIDGASVPVAATGDPIKGVDIVAIPDSATSVSTVTPATLPPTGGIANGHLTIKSATPLPSGTVVQAQVAETFSLTTGETASEEKRLEDIVLFRAAGATSTDLSADFPIVASRSFKTTDLIEGKVHLDILAGRESVRGQTGGSQALTLTSGSTTLTIPAGSLPDDSAIALQSDVLSSFLPSTASATPIAEVLLDFGGLTLAQAAQLSIPSTGVSSTDSVVIARVERVQGVPKVVVVAAMSLVGTRYVTAPLQGLSGIVRDGRYVFYRVSGSWGLVTGTVSMPLGAGPAVLQTAALPFVGITDAQNQFTLVAAAGTTAINASVPGTSLAGAVTAQVIANQTVNASIALSASATTATVVPANGAIRVPTTQQIEITASAPLNLASANATSIRLADAGGQLVSLRFVSSGSGRIIAAVPLTALVAGATYTLTVNGLTDAFGGAVSVPAVSFTTQPDIPPSYDVNKITFTMPDSNGMVTVSAPAGSLPSGTRILIVNSGNGVVVSYTVGNDGSFTGTFPATISDRLMVTITDPKGNVINFERSKFVATDGSGRVAVGPAGGTVEGTGGTAIIIPDGALDRGAVFKVEAFGPEAFTERPDLPNAHFGSGLKITSEEKPTLKQEGKLVFPKPADAPDGAFYYVYKRVTGPNGEVRFETIDHAFIGADGKVTTASYPFIGWTDSVDAWNAEADTGSVGLGLGASIAFTMMWTWDAMLPGMALPGLISGRVLRPQWNPGELEPVYVPVPGAIVIRVRENNLAASPTFAQSQSDGTFALWDPQYTGGTVELKAFYGSETATVTAFEANPVNSRSFAFVFSRYANVASANLTFAPLQQTKVAAIETHVMKLDAQGKRQEAGGIVIAGTPLVIGFKYKGSDSKPVIQNAAILGQSFAVKPDDTSDALKMDFIVSETYVPAQPGSYSITATALPPLGGSPILVSHTILVVASGGNNTRALNGTPPDIISDLLDPKNESEGNAPNVFPQVTFTEPVTHVAGNVTLSDDQGPVAIAISGVGVDSQGNQFAIADLAAQSSNTAVTSITIQPKQPLKYATEYTLKLTDGVVDTDTTTTGGPDPHALRDAPRTFTFTTLAPTVLGSTGDAFPALAAVALDDRVYVASNGTPHGSLRIYDIGSDPSAPALKNEQYVPGSPSFIAGDATSEITGGRVVAIPATIWYLNSPSNLFLYDVSTDSPVRIGAASLTESTQAGVALRVALHGRYAYAWTFPVGLQVVDMRRMVQNQANADPATMNRYLVTEGGGFGHDAVVNTIPVPTPTGGSEHVLGLKVGDYVTGGVSQPLIIATGSIPLLVVNPQTSQTLFKQKSLSSAVGSLTWGWSLGLARAAQKDIAVVVGTGSTPQGSGSIVAVADLADPANPQLIGALKLDDQATDIAINDTLALVATRDAIILVNFSDPTKPVLAGKIPNIGGRLAIADGGLIAAVGDGTAGLKTAALGSFALIHGMSLVEVDDHDVLDRDVDVSYQIASPPADLKEAHLTLFEKGGTLATYPLPDLTPGVHNLTIPKGLQLKPTPEKVEVTVVRSDGTETTPYVTSRTALEQPPDNESNSTIASKRPTIAAATIDGQQTFIDPGLVARGAAGLTVNFTTYSLPVPTISVRKIADASWLSLPVTSTTTATETVISVAVPSSLLTDATIIQLARDQDNIWDVVPLLVYDPTLPPLGTTFDINPNGARLAEEDDHGVIAVTGFGFEDGMRIVVGRGNTPGFALATDFVSFNSLEARVPVPFFGMADDLFVAVLTKDGTMLSGAVPLIQSLPPGSRTADEAAEDEAPPSLTDNFGANDVEVTDVSVIAPGTLQLVGVGLKNGAIVNFRSTSATGEVTVATSTLEQVEPVSSASAAIAAGRLTPGPTLLPDEVTAVLMKALALIKLPPRNVQSASITGTAQSGRTAVSSPIKQIAILEELRLPFGGVLDVSVYHPKSKPKDIIILAHDEYVAHQADYTDDVELPGSLYQSISVGQNTGSYGPYLQLEHDSNTRIFQIRGTGLTTLDDLATNITNLPTLTFSGSTTSIPRKVAVVFRTFGKPRPVNRTPGIVPGVQQRIDTDRIVAKLANKYHISPVYLKGQIEKESGFTKNFRYEFSTRDLKLLSSGAPSVFYNHDLRLHQVYFARHLIQGNVLAPNQQAIAQPFTAAEAHASSYASNLPAFTLTYQAKRRKGFDQTITAFEHNGRIAEANKANLKYGRTPLPLMDSTTVSAKARLESDAAVTATIIKDTVEQKPDLTLVHCDDIYRRATKKAGVPIDPHTLPSANEFCVDYRSREVTIGRSLSSGETLRVTYYPVTRSALDFLIPISANGDAVNQFGVGTSAKVIHDTHSDNPLVAQSDYTTSGGNRWVKFREQDTSSQHLARNMSVLSSTIPNAILPLPSSDWVNNDPYADLLKVTQSDSRVEFRVDPATNMPTVARDPKLDFNTAQFWASASYGPLQVTFDVWLGTGKKAKKFNDIFDLSKKSAIELLWNFEAGAELGAAYAGDLFAAYQKDLGTQTAWETTWKKVFSTYNAGSPDSDEGAKYWAVVRANACAFIPSGTKRPDSCK